jgi:hypothetical protein
MANKCACIRRFYDFDLQETNCSKIVYSDRSDFQQGDEYTDTPSYTLNLTSPDGSTSSYNVTVGTGLTIDLGKCTLPGIYEFSVTSCTEVFTKRVPIICSLYCGYLKAVAKLGKGVEVEMLRSIRERLEYITQIASTDFVTASFLIDSVSRDLERINCDCSCS